MITNKQKSKIREAVQAYRANFKTQTQCAAALEIDKAQYTEAIVNGKLDKVIADDVWMRIAMRLKVQINDLPTWKIAPTKVYIYLTEQFKICQAESMCGLFCDRADIGKTIAAEDYAAKNPNAVVVDCSQYKTKRRLIKEIARQFGLNTGGVYWDMWEDLVWFINNADHPFIILDEAGDMAYETFLEVKGLWNATKYRCGWFMLGADALRVKIENGMNLKRVGFEEMFSRYGAKFQRCIGEGEDATTEEDMQLQAALIAKLNAPRGANIHSLVARSEGSLRRLWGEIVKLQRTQA